MPHDTVWQAGDGRIAFFEEDSSGNAIGLADQNAYDPLTDTPLFEPCFHQNTTIRSTMSTQRRPVTGRARRKITREIHEYSATTDYLYTNKAGELRINDMYNRQMFVTVVYLLLDVYTEPHFLRRGIVTVWNLVANDGDNLTLDIELQAESFD